MVDIDKLKAIARYKGVKLSALCKELGEDPSYFDKVKRGLRRMDDNRIAYIADRLGTSFESLTTGSKVVFSATHLNPNINQARVPQFSFQRMEKLRVEKGLLPGYMETYLDVPAGYLKRAENGEFELFPKQVVKLSVLLDTTYDYLMGLTDDPAIPLDDQTGVKIKVFGDVAAGIPIKQIDNFDPEDADSWEEINRTMARGGVYFALRIKGDSMEPRIFDGDTVIVRYQDTIESGETAIVAINGDEATCKRVTLTSDGLILNANNPKYAPRFFSTEAVQKLPITILGKVVEVRGKV